MRLITLFIAFLSLSFSGPAFAQNGGIGNIFEDIFRGQNQYPTPRFPQNQIDNIPVSIFNKDGRDLGGHILIVTAYSVPPANVRIAKPQLLGETRILLTGLGDPLQLVVAAPAIVTQGINAARVTARVINENGAVILSSRDDAYYRGQDAAELNLISTAGSQHPTSGEKRSRLQGIAKLPQGAMPLPRGGNLVVALTEASPPYKVIAKTQINIDQSSAPFAFSLDHPDISTQENAKFLVRADIHDWAGRTTHQTTLAVPYVGADAPYHIQLEEKTILAGSPLAPAHNAALLTRVQGEAIFDAYKGLPKGTKMTVIVRQADATDRIMASKTIALNHIAGPVKFNLPLPDPKSNAAQSPAILDIRITNANGKTLFAAPFTKIDSQYMRLRLRTDPRY